MTRHRTPRLPRGPRPACLAALLGLPVLLGGAGGVRAAEDPAPAGAPETPPVPLPDPGQAPVPGGVAEPLPLTGPAYLLLTRANTALETGDYTRAIPDLEEAIRQRPDVLRLRTALVAALVGAGRGEAAAAAARAAAGDENLPAASRARMAQLARAPGEALPARAVSEADPAYRAAGAAYAAYGRGEYAEAVARARAAVELAPDRPGYRSLLATAEAARDRAARPAPVPVRRISPADRAANAAYAAQRRSDDAAALAAARRAVDLAPGRPASWLLLVDLLAADGQAAEARAAADRAIAATGESRALLRRRGVLSLGLGDAAAARDDLTRALALPGPGDEERALRLQLATAALEAGDPQAALQALAPLGEADDPDLWLARGRALAAAGDPRAARGAFDRALALAGSDDMRDDMRAEAALGRIDATRAAEGLSAARAQLLQDREAGHLAALPPLDMAYLAGRSGAPELADAAFSAADAGPGTGTGSGPGGGGLQGAQLVDAAYAARRVAANDRAIALLERAIDAADAGSYAPDPQQRYNIRRDITELGRRWGGNVALTYGSSGVSDGFLVPPSSEGELLQLGAEIWWRPPHVGNRNGRLVELFARQFTTLSDSRDGPVGLTTTQVAAGVRVKPFADVNATFEAAKYLGLGSAAGDDFLLRAAISDGFGTDLVPGETSWLTGQYYAEAGRYLQSDQSFASGNARLGRSYRMDGAEGNLVLTPFAGLSADWNDGYATAFALGAGPGLHLRYWVDESRYRAPAAHVDLDLQYRVKLAGDNRAEGWFLTLGFTF